eukprot:TRINITY_DN3341_c0_g1_i5.p1 TRINITY_DN3341_c0_g1~~TRINITY_DN3341_c0_g1_i5.p1  ORF type:complete len:138 (+),score=51.21 TRINITY_DN3341_c0_g1_i5:2-415(+)
MRAWALLFLAGSAFAMPQTNFQFGSVPNRKIFIRGDEQETLRGVADTENTSEENENEIGGRIPGGESFANTETVEVEETFFEEACCCIPVSEECQSDLVGLGLINPRIVNRPTTENSSTTSCQLDTRYVALEKLDLK